MATISSYQNKPISYEATPATAVDLFQVLFIGLKLTNFITWSWWFVLSPYLASFVIAVLIVTIFNLTKN